MTRNDEKFVAVAVEEAEKSQLMAKLGCIAVINGKIVARGFNHYRTFSKDGIIERTCSCHAEMDVLRKCLKQKKIRKLAIYVARISRNGNLMCSAPCKRCMEKMQMFHIKTITYINIEGDIVKQNFEDYHTEHQSSGYNAIKYNRVKCI
jgi:deoxycytidylate deaminase